MKSFIKYFLLISLFLLNTTSCSDNGEMKITGRVGSFTYVGLKCWYLVDLSNGFHYELVSNDDLLCREGLKVSVKAKKSNADTICKVGDRIEVTAYKIIREVEEIRTRNTF